MSILTSPTVHPIVLERYLTRLLNGMVWVDWDSEALKWELEDITHDSVNRIVWSKIQALRAAHKTERPWTDWEVFAPICDVFNDRLPDFLNAEPTTLRDAAFGVTVLRQLDAEQSFSGEVGRYIAASAKHFGQFLMPPMLEFAQEYAAEPRFTCPVCRKTGIYNPDHPQKYCDSCSGKYEIDHPFMEDANMERILPEQTLTPVKVHYLYDYRPAQKILISLLNGEKLALKNDDSDHIQAARALVAVQYVKAKDAVKDNA